MRIAFASLGLLALAACSSNTPRAEAPPPAQPQSTAQQAVAVLASASGSRVSGKLTLAPMGDGVHISGEVGGLPASGQFGFHVHEKGDCSAVDASSAGGHFNPTASNHGRASGPAHHAGDMDNIVSDGSGVAAVNVHLRGVTLGGGALSDIEGRAVVVHASADDYSSQPAGNAGARVACGVIRVTR